MQDSRSWFKGMKVKRNTKNDKRKIKFGPGGGGALTILCVRDIHMPPSRVCFSQFVSGKGVVFSPTVWQGYGFHGFCLGRALFSGPIVWQGVCFDPGLMPKFWQGL